MPVGPGVIGRHWSSLVIIGRHRLSLAVIGFQTHRSVHTVSKQLRLSTAPHVLYG